jgi:hypothetical protein
MIFNPNNPVPVPAPMLEMLFAKMGFGLVLQHTPRAVMGAPPSWITFPPETADVALMEVMISVVTVGIESVEVLMQRTELP